MLRVPWVGLCFRFPSFVVTLFKFICIYESRMAPARSPPLPSLRQAQPRRCRRRVCDRRLPLPRPRLMQDALPHLRYARPRPQGEGYRQRRQDERHARVPRLRCPLYPVGLSAAQRMRLRLHIQAIKSDTIVNCFPGAPRPSHHSRVNDFTSPSPLAGISTTAAAAGMRDLAGAWVHGAGRPPVRPARERTTASGRRTTTPTSSTSTFCAPSPSRRRAFCDAARPRRFPRAGV